jgi:hypothetical protein
MSFLFAAPVSVDIQLDDADKRAKVTINHDKGKSEELYRFTGNEDVRGKVVLRLKDASKPLAHNGIKVEFVGQIGEENNNNKLFEFFFSKKKREKSVGRASKRTLTLARISELFYDRGNHYDFTSLQFDLAQAGGQLTQEVTTFPFEFLNAEKQYESYNGINVRLRYFLRVVITRSFVPNVTKELDLWVVNYHKPPEMNNTIKMEVGIEDCESR